MHRRTTGTRRVRSALVRLAVVTALMGGCGWGAWAVSLGASAVAFLVPFAVAKSHHVQHADGGRIQVPDKSLFLADLPRCRACLQRPVASDGRRAGLLACVLPFSLLVLPITLWILTRVISKCDKGRFRKPPPEKDTHTSEERLREKQEMFS